MNVLCIKNWGFFEVGNVYGIKKYEYCTDTTVFLSSTSRYGDRFRAKDFKTHFEELK